ncbi:transcriptional regulator [Flavobacterium akiainvivens]|uniref:Transcriptional regulator n=1 Tax=Flavobacterium akiainvivens TaxID=1202724 RepID=A0A0M8MBK4_9FLAO|nr:LytTR family DNA-binding domain-containing protein [Flavobacterium akiainvivens]KOS06685.1 transcriptional regulator [Flavobacterium akiainvivens]SFQ70866.1 two component transcriptional regulator, LytTR family [Flavobacterium akiainvivens]
MNCIIVDDEPLAREGLEALLAEVSDIEVLGRFSNAPTALAFLETTSPDVVFLDIQMPKVTGLEFAARVPATTMIIFTTAYSQYALQSYELDAIDYLLKPIEKHRLEKAVAKATQYKTLLSDQTEKSVVEDTGNDFLLIKADRRYYKVNYNEILFIEGLKDYVVLYTQKQKLITAMNLKTIQQKLNPQDFMRVSKSYIVNIKGVDSFDTHILYIGEHEVPLGEVYKNEFFSRFLGNQGE